MPAILLALAAQSALAQTPSFPGAEGAGTITTGTRKNPNTATPMKYSAAASRLTVVAMLIAAALLVRERAGAKPKQEPDLPDSSDAALGPILREGAIGLRQLAHSVECSYGAFKVSELKARAGPQRSP